MMRKRRDIQSVDTLYGGFWTRFVAWIIDAIIISVALAIIRLATQGFEQSTSDALFNTVVAWTYFVVLTAARGQTVGKMAVGVKVVTAHGQKPGVGAVLLREVVGKTISAVILFVGFLLIAVDGRKRGLHDRIGSTFVEKV